MNKYIHHILLVIMTLMTTCTFSSCSDESMFCVGSDTFANSQITISALLPDDKDLSTRVSYEPITGKKGLRTKWEEGDKITIYNITKKAFFVYSYKGSGELLWVNTNNDATYNKGDELVAVFHPTTEVTGVTTTMNFNNQDGSFEDFANHDLMLSEKVTVTSRNIQFHMVRQNAFIRIAVKKDLIESYLDTRDGVTLTISGNIVNTGLSGSSINLNQQSYDRNGNGNIEFKLNRQDLFNEKDALGQPTDYYQFYVAVPSYDGRVPITRIRITGVNRVFNVPIPQNLEDKSFNNIVMAPGYVYRTKLGDLTEAYLLPGRQFNVKIQELLTINSLTCADIDKITFINRNEDLNPTSNDVEIQESGEIAYARLNGREIIIFTEADVISANSNSSQMFMDWTSLDQFEDIQLLKTSKVRDMSSMFENCISLHQLNVSTFDTQGVTNMSSMFKGCTNLVAVNTKYLFNTSNVQDMSSMFEGCKSISTFNNIITNFETNNVTNMSSMFKDCRNTTSMTIPFDIRNVENISSMFEGCSNLLTLNLNFRNGLNGSYNLRNMDAMFKDCVKLENIDFNGIQALKVESMNSLFQNCEQLKKVDISTLFDSDDLLRQIFIDIPTRWFDNLRKIVSPKEVNYMFDSCTRLEELNIGWAFYLNEQECEGAFRNFTTESSSKKCTITLSQWCYDAISNNYKTGGNSIGFADKSTTITWKNANTLFGNPTFPNLWQLN